MRTTNYDKTFDLSKPGLPSETKDAPEPSANVEDDSECDRCKNDTSKPSTSKSTDYATTFYSGPSASFKTKHKKLEKNNMLVLKDKYLNKDNRNFKWWTITIWEISL